MYIRRYTLFVLGLIVFGLLVFGLGYQYYHSMDNRADMEDFKGNFRFARADENIQIYEDGEWEDIELRGLELSSFTPGYARYKTDIDKELVGQWLEEISDLNANLIKIPGIQPPSFYNAIYDYNQGAKNPIYTIHEVTLDERSILENYDIYDKKLTNKFKRDIKRTINVVHGRAALFSKKRSHSGLYLKDISKYNLGYILGTNTNPEIISLTDRKHASIDEYKGDYISLEEGSAFEAYIAKMLDFATSYEINKYKQVSLMSYLTRVETDPLDYKHESNQTSKAKINMDKISSQGLDNLFVAYKHHPNSVDFLDYEYEDLNLGEGEETESDFYRHLDRIGDFYQRPILISDTGISSSRAISKVDLRDGFHRGGFSEADQGKNIVRLLEDIDKSGLAGGVIHSWQDDWTSVTSLNNLVDYLDESASSYWYNNQASDEAFGLAAFELDENEEKIYIDGDFEDWKPIDYSIDKEVKLKVKWDPSFLYLYVEKKDWNFEEEEIYLGIDLTPKSGSDYWEEKDVSFDLPVDFVLDLNGYLDSSILVHDRYNIFDYLYKYYAPIIGKKDRRPDSNKDEFSPIYLLNRKRFYFTDRDEISPPIYYETGSLRHGSDNPDSKNYNSLADFNRRGDILEVKLPWDILNVKNPIEMELYDDFYLQGIDKKLKVDSIGFSIYDKAEEKTFKAEETYKLRRGKTTSKYEHRLKDSYYILKEYWGGRR